MSSQNRANLVQQGLETFPDGTKVRIIFKLLEFFSFLEFPWIYRQQNYKNPLFGNQEIVQRIFPVKNRNKKSMRFQYPLPFKNTTKRNYHSKVGQTYCLNFKKNKS